MNRWYFWVLALIMLATAFGLVLLPPAPTPVGQVVSGVFCATLLLATFGLARPRRHSWALRAVAGVVLVAYLAYAAGELVDWWNGKPLGADAPRSRPNLYNALRGLLAFGVPSVYLLLKGRTGTVVDDLLEEPRGEGGAEQA